MSEKKFYVYVHRRATDGTIFYVGKGKGCRATSTKNRNLHWRRTVNKHGFSVHYVADCLSETCAFSLERALIKFYGKDSLCNLTDGGEGISGFQHSDASREKMKGKRPDAAPWLKGKFMPDYLKSKLRDAKLGRKQSPDHAQKSRTNKIGKKIADTSKFNLEKRKPVSNSFGEIFPSAAEAARQMSVRLGVNASQGNITMAILGHRKTAYGMEWHHAPA